MDMKLGITRSDLPNAFIRRDKEIYAEAEDKEKKKQKAKIVKKKPKNNDFKDLFKNFHSIDFIG